MESRDAGQVAPDGKLEVAPLRSMNVVKDLAVEMTDFFDKLQNTHQARMRELG